METDLKFGVILWSSPASGEAVIWCEESAAIAYYTPDVSTGTPQRTPDLNALDAGDLVHFELCASAPGCLLAVNLHSAGPGCAAIPRARHTASRVTCEAGTDAAIYDFRQHCAERAADAPVSRRG